MDWHFLWVFEWYIQDWIVFQDATLSSIAFYMYLLYRYWIQCIHEDKHTCIWGKKSVLNFLKYVLYFFTSAWSSTLFSKWRLHLCKWRLNFATLYMYSTYIYMYFLRYDGESGPNPLRLVLPKIGSKGQMAFKLAINKKKMNWKVNCLQGSNDFTL